MRWVIVRVLPVPAPARMQTGPRTARTAWHCSGSSPASTSSASTSPDPARREGHCRASRYSVAQRPEGASMSALTMYTTTWCGYCIRLKKQLERAGIAYAEVDIERDGNAAELVESV